MRWTKIILFICLISTFSCTKMEIEPTVQPKPKVDIFTLEQSKVVDGEEIMFNLTTDGDYIIKLTDKVSDQVLSKEKINGKKGINNFKIYTKSLPVQYLYLTIEDMDKNQIGKTIITTN